MALTNIASSPIGPPSALLGANAVFTGFVHPQFPLPPAQTMVFPAVPQHEHVIVGPEKLELTEDIHFEFDKAVIQPVSYPILKELAQVLKEYPDLRIRVEGNTDSVGSDEYNQKLSDRRAKAVRDFLIGVGIAGERMQSIGRGETNPIPALEAVSKMQPELIYLLTDGDFSGPGNQAVIDFCQKQFGATKTKINTIAFVAKESKVNPQDLEYVKALQQIAKNSGGQFKHVTDDDMGQR